MENKSCIILLRYVYCIHKHYLLPLLENEMLRSSLLQLAYNSFLKIIKSSTGGGSIFKKVKFYPSELILCNSLYIYL